MKKTYTYFKAFLLASAIYGAQSAAAQTARLQIIHNAADPAAAVVDIYANGEKLLDDVKFRTASPYLSVPAGIPITVAVAPSNSTSASQAIFSVPLTLSLGETYVAVANGLVATGFAANPDSKSTNFGIWVKAGAKETAPAGKVDLLVVHGATDAPAVDVVAEGVATIVNNAVYGDITNYISVPAAAYTLAVQDSTGKTTVARFAAGLSGLGGSSAVVFASGFLTPASNKGGPAFGLFAALPNGTVVPLDAVTGLNDQLKTFASVIAFPVPAQDNLTIEIMSASSEIIEVEVLDLTGKSLNASNYKAFAGSNQFILNTENLKAGSYIAKIKGQSNISAINFSVSK